MGDGSSTHCLIHKQDICVIWHRYSIWAASWSGSQNAFDRFPPRRTALSRAPHESRLPLTLRLQPACAVYILKKKQPWDLNLYLYEWEAQGTTEHLFINMKDLCWWFTWPQIQLAIGQILSLSKSLYLCPMHDTAPVPKTVPFESGSLFPWLQTSGIGRMQIYWTWPVSQNK